MWNGFCTTSCKTLTKTRSSRNKDPWIFYVIEEIQSILVRLYLQLVLVWDRIEAKPQSNIFIDLISNASGQSVVFRVAGDHIQMYGLDNYV